MHRIGDSLIEAKILFLFAYNSIKVWITTLSLVVGIAESEVKILWRKKYENCFYQ